MKVLKTLGLVVLAALLLVLVVGLFLPGTVRIERRLQISGDRARIHDLIATPRAWKQWSLWNDANYPDLSHSYAGPESGVDAEHRWKGSGREGYLKVTASDPRTGVSFDLGLDSKGPPWKVVFAYADGKDGGTEVTWTLAGEASGLSMKYILALFKGGLEEQLDESLRGLRDLVRGGDETPVAPVESVRSD